MDKVIAAVALIIMAAPSTAEVADARIAELERRLVAERNQLELANKRIQDIEAQLAELKRTSLAAEPHNAMIAFPGGSDSVLIVGGAMRVNYAVGSYGEGTGSPSRASGDGGNFTLDTARFDADYIGPTLDAKFQYRFYDGYHVLHTADLGYRIDDNSRIRLGVTRVPFGPSDFGISQSWFFDQHFYVGLADDMDLGIRYSRSFSHTEFDVAYFVSDEGSWAGSSRESARYAYDIVNESGAGYEERGQFNLRGIHSIVDDSSRIDIGASLQYSRLKSRGNQSNGNGVAISLHSEATLDRLSIAAQLTRFDIDVSEQQSLGTENLVQFGGFDAPATVAAAAWIPAVSFRYKLVTEEIPWLDSVMPYLEYSAVIKDERSFNDSELFVLGAAWSRKGWYIYSDLALSNGNEFVGGESEFGDRLGANLDNQWQYRFNLNFGVYFGCASGPLRCQR